VIVYTGQGADGAGDDELRKLADTIVVKDASSPERLLDETALFLHRVERKLPQEKRRLLEQLHSAEEVFKGQKILIVDDDVRNVFALTSVLEAPRHGGLYAENGKDGIELLRQTPEVDLVLMDIMMPELDGYETTRLIRADESFSSCRSSR
jgi:PleD family two-component response regulator